MAITMECAYAGGDPRLADVFRGTLSADQAELRFAHNSVWMEGMTPKTRADVLTWPAANLLGVSVGDVATIKGLMVGGLVPVGDDLMLGGIGEIGGGTSALLLFLLSDPGLVERRLLVRFASTAPEAKSFQSALQRERLVLGLSPLPGVEDVDSRTRSEDQAAVLVELRDLAREQVELLRTIASRLGSSIS